VRRVLGLPDDERTTRSSRLDGPASNRRAVELPGQAGRRVRTVASRSWSRAAAARRPGTTRC